jgi:EAL domain-containing protein (putative c-di-GMP-specific phosphodiesterase class I)
MDRTNRHTAFAQLPHTQDSTGTLVAWFTSPPGALVQISRSSELTVEMTRWLVEHGCSELLDRFPGPTPLAIVLDIRLMTKRQPAVRSLLVEAAKKLGPRLGTGYVIPPESAGKVYLASLHAAAAALRVFGARIEIAESLSILVDTKRIRPIR